MRGGRLNKESDNRIERKQQTGKTFTIIPKRIWIGEGKRKRFFVCLFVSIFLGLRPQHVEVPRLGVELELQPPAYARAMATLDPSRVCNLHHSSPLSKGRDRTRNLMVPSRIR